MFANSLFKDYIMENGMKDWKGESTRDIICLEFNFGTRSYEEEIAHIKKIAKNARIDRKRAKSINSKKQIEIQENKKRKIQDIIIFLAINLPNNLIVKYFFKPFSNIFRCVF